MARQVGSVNGMRCGRCGMGLPAGMRFCGACGAPLDDASVASPADSSDSAQRRHLTVMFCDLVGSTSLAESLDPEDFRDVLRDYQQACARAIEQFGGYTAKYIGDGLLAYFGYPRAHEDDPQRAVHAGLGIVAQLAVLNQRLGERFGISLHVRIGVHTGLVVAGEMGAGQSREQRAIVGEVPHIAARLESIAEPDSIAISDVTRDLILGYFETEPVGERLLKGLSNPVGVHRVARATGAVDRLEVPSSRRLTPLVGRDDELARLTSAWRLVADGEGVLVHVTGEPGIGKSRLVRTLRERLGDQVRAVQKWQCSAHYESSSLHPVIRFLVQLLGFDGADEHERKLQTLEELLRGASMDPVEAVPLLAELLSLATGDRSVRPALAPRDERAATMRVLESLLVSNSALHPLLLIAEDLQWADPTTVELLGRIVTNLQSLPILCVLTFRGEFKPPWANRPAVVDIELERLTAGDVRAMVLATSAAELDAAILDRVTAAADGVPLFVEEMLKMLDHTGPVERLARGTIGRGSGAMAVPSTLQGLLTERLDRLSDLREIVDLAAVLGREFPMQLLEALEPFGGADLEPALAQLVAEDVLRPIGEARSRYEFSHALLQEAAYELLLRRRRQELHAQVADVLSRTFPAIAEQEPEVVAHHWSCAAEPMRAVPWWRVAGTRALERAAFLEAADHFRRGVEALDASAPRPSDDLQRVEFLTLLAASLQAGRGYAAPGVEPAYQQARSGCGRLRNQAPLIAVIRGQWMFHLLRADYPTALDLANEMLTLGSQGGDPVRLAEGHLYRGLVHMYLADFESARQHLERAFASYERPDRHDQIYEAQGDTGVGALAYLAPVLWNLGYADESRERSDLSLELAERVGGPMTRAQAWGMRSLVHLSRAEPVELLHWTEKTRAHSVDRNIGYWRILSSLIRGWLQGRSGDLDAGIVEVRESLDAYLDSGSRLGLPLFSMLLSDLWLATGEQHRALEVLGLGEEHIEATGERFSESELFQMKGKLLMASRSPDPDGASAAYERALGAAREQHAKLLELRAATRLAAHQRRIGERCTALDVVASLYGWFGATSELPDVARARVLISGKGPAS